MEVWWLMGRDIAYFDVRILASAMLASSTNQWAVDLRLHRVAWTWGRPASLPAPVEFGEKRQLVSRAGCDNFQYNKRTSIMI